MLYCEGRVSLSLMFDGATQWLPPQFTVVTTEPQIVAGGRANVLYPQEMGGDAVLEFVEGHPVFSKQKDNWTNAAKFVEDAVPGEKITLSYGYVSALIFRHA